MNNHWIAAALVAATAIVTTAPTVRAEGDPAKGEKVFRKCKACHMVGDGAKNRVGPVLTGILEQPAGQVAGFAYSDALLERAAGGLVWDTATLSAFLTKPKEVVPGTKMSFAGLRRDQEVADVIAFLAQQP